MQRPYPLSEVPLNARILDAATLVEPDRHVALGEHPLSDASLTAFVEELAPQVLEAVHSARPLGAQDAGFEGPARLAHLYRGLQEPSSWGLGVYSGLLGALWGLWYLQRHGAIRTGVDYATASRGLHEAFMRTADREQNDCLMFGELGYLAFRRLVTGSETFSDRAYELAASGFANEVDEVFWGAPSYAYACMRMHELDGNGRWIELFREIAEYIWARRVTDQASGARLWRQKLDGVCVQHLGAAHGFAGVIGALLAGFRWLPVHIQSVLMPNVADTLARTVTRACGPIVNWPQSIAGHRPGRVAPLMQWCHGAPGIVTSLYQARQFPRLDLVQRAAESVWLAGPLAKGRGGYCHGTAGNGYAFLGAYQKTGESRWLDRARAFAGHALASSRDAAVRYGGYKLALWTGDVGTAVFALDALIESPGFLTLDKFQ